ncbi:putative dCTP diphosphatase [Helianthus annuus]|nr:putative dCTP diphosphatase [Helianthus annuus]KAJ0659393.1 putative dCTP diphosphatase [Helianthus annuus]KAJ0703050.1 putative dCTP diphosphatase [Helianthus annuus]
MSTPADTQDDVSLSELKNKMADFAQERDWDQFHSPRNLLLALVISPISFSLLGFHVADAYVSSIYTI